MGGHSVEVVEETAKLRQLTALSVLSWCTVQAVLSVVALGVVVLEWCCVVVLGVVLLRWSSVVLLRWSGVVLLHWSGVVLLRWSGVVLLHWSGVVLLRWGGVVLLRWGGVEVLYIGVLLCGVCDVVVWCVRCCIALKEVAMKVSLS